MTLEENPLEKILSKEIKITSALSDGDLITARNLLKTIDTIPDDALYNSVVRNNFHCAKYLVKKGADIHKIYKSFFNDNILYLTYFHKNFEMFKFFIDKGVENLRSGREIFGIYEFDKYMIEKGQPVTEDLLMSSFYHNLEITKLLLNNVSSDFDINSDDSVILYTAVDHNYNFELIKLLIDHGADVNGEGIFKYVVYKGNVDIIKLFIEKGVDINSNDGLILKWAINYNNFEILNILINLNVNIEPYKEELLETLVLLEHLEMLKILINLPNIKNSVDYNHLYNIAVEENNTEIVNFLSDFIF